MSPPPDQRPITVEIPVAWTAEQALAVWEMLDDMREKVWARYSQQLQELLAEQQQHPVVVHDNTGPRCTDF